MDTTAQFCPNCLGRGEKHPLKRLFINFEETVSMCSATHCMYFSHDAEHQPVPLAPEPQSELPAAAADNLDDFDTFLNSLCGPAADSGVVSSSVSSGLVSDASQGGSGLISSTGLVSDPSLGASLGGSGLVSDTGLVSDAGLGGGSGLVSDPGLGASLGGSGLVSDPGLGGSGLVSDPGLGGSGLVSDPGLGGSALVSDPGLGWSSASEASLFGSVASEPCVGAAAARPSPAPPSPRSLPDTLTARHWRWKARESLTPPPGLALRAFNNTSVPRPEPRVENSAGGSGARPRAARSRRRQPGVYVVTGERFRPQPPVWERAAVPLNAPNSLMQLVYGPAEVRRIRRRLRRHAAARRPPAAAEATADALQRLQVASPVAAPPAAAPRQVCIPPPRVRRSGPSAQDVAAALDRSLSQAGNTRDLQRKLNTQQVYVRSRQVARMKAWAKKRAAPAR